MYISSFHFKRRYSNILFMISDDFSLAFFHAPPQKVAGYYVIPSELLSVCPSVCPSVRPSAVEHSCPVHNFDTV